LRYSKRSPCSLCVSSFLETFAILRLLIGCAIRNPFFSAFLAFHGLYDGIVIEKLAMIEKEANPLNVINS
jgi:hypothetical protein